MDEAMTILKEGANSSLPLNVYFMWIFMENLKYHFQFYFKIQNLINVFNVKWRIHTNLGTLSKMVCVTISELSLSAEINMTHLNGMALSPRTPTKHQRSCAWTLHSRHSDASQSGKGVVICHRQFRKIHKCIAKPQRIILIASTLVS